MATDQPTDARSTETTDPLETVMEAAEELADDPCAWPSASEYRIAQEERRERLRLHVQLALAKARYDGQISGRPVDGAAAAEIAVLEARVQED